MTRWIILTLCLLLAAPASARPAVDMQARPAAADHLRFGDPVPVSVLLTNLGPSCRLRVEARPVYDWPLASADAGRGESLVDLPSGARKRLTLLIPELQGSNQLEVTAWDGRDEVARRSLDLDVDYSRDPVTVILSPDPGAFAWLTSYKWGSGQGARELSVSQVPAEGFPEEAAALAGLDLVVLHDLPRLGLSHRSQQALADWVRAGGRMLLFASPDPAEFRGSPLETLLPLRPTGTAPADGLPVLVGALDRSEVLLSRGAHPLLVAGSRVAGVVALVTTPLPTTDILGSKATSDLFQRFVVHCDDCRALFPEQEKDLTLLSDPPELEPPDLALVAWCMLGYVLLVGPVNWMVLRRRDRMLRIFLTVPLLAGGFALLTFLAGWMVRGDELLLLETGQISLVSGQASARWQGATALYSPRTTSYTLFYPLSIAVKEDRGNGVLGDSGSCLALEERQELRDLQVRMWSMRRFRGQGPILLRGPISVEPEGRTVRVANDAEVDLHDCHVVLGPRSSPAFELAAGAKATVALSATSSLDVLLQDSQQKERFQSDRRRLTEGALKQVTRTPDRPYLMGWTRDSASSVECSDSRARQATLNMVLVQGEVVP